MTNLTDQVQEDQKRIDDARHRGRIATFLLYTRMSGPGWLQGAITLGGGTLAGSLYLGSIGGFEMLWLQPIMMFFGIVMLCAIGYVTLSTGERPFLLVNRHVNPVLGWSWIIATLMANLVWAMPQFALGAGAIQQNLELIPDTSAGRWITALVLLVVSSVVVWFYDSGGWSIKLFELILKLMVGLVVLSFFAVIVVMSVNHGLPWGDVFGGFVPNPALLFEPTGSLEPLISQSSNPEYWKNVVVSSQRDRMVAAAASAVGINMTFLLPYSMLKRGWNQKFSGLAVFDLSTGLFIPFVLASSCVIIAAASQFHGQSDPSLIAGMGDSPQARKAIAAYETSLDDVLRASRGDVAFEELRAEQASLNATDTSGPLDLARAALPEQDKILASTLVARDAGTLSNSLENLAGQGAARIVFGVGVVGMAISSIIILMLANGFTICEMAGVPSHGTLYRCGSFLPALTGLFGFLFLWSNKEANFYLAVPTSRFGMVLLPLAYVTFFMLMNNRKVLGDRVPCGMKRIILNTVMLMAIALSLCGAGVSILNETAVIPHTSNSNTGYEGVRVRDVALLLIGVLVVAAVYVHRKRMKPFTDSSDI